MKKNIPIFLIALLQLNASFGQKNYTTAQDVYQSDELTFYGYDFSHLKLAETKRLNEDFSQQIILWTSFCQQHITDEKLAAWFRKEKVTSNITPTIGLAKNINGKEVVTYAKNIVPQDSLQSYINRYSLIEKEGVGLAVILECFDKVTNKTSGYFTFFDIASKKILISDYFIGKEVDGYGLTNYWGISIVGTTKNYASSYRDKAKSFRSKK